MIVYDPQVRNSWRIFTRDVGRLFHQRKAWVIVVGVLITPALYAWFNINAFWDPYANTENIGVAVVNLDEGSTSELTGSLDVGAQVVDQLADDTQLGWQFMDEDEAQAAVRSGDVYAAIVIPADFSANLLSITSGDFTQPTLRYYVNEKASAIAPKITDAGASGIDDQITSSFRGQVAEAVTEILKDAGEDTELRLLNARDDTLNAFDEATATITSAREDIGQLASGLGDARSTLSSAQGALDDIDATLSDVQSAIAQAQSIISEAQQQVVAFTDAATSAYVDGATLLADASAQAHVSVTALTQAFEQAGVQVDSAIDGMTAVVAANADAIARLQALVDDASLDPTVTARLTEVITQLQSRNQADQDLLTQLSDLNSDAAASTAALQSAADALDAAVQDAKRSASGIRSLLMTTVPALNQAMSALSTSAGAFSAALSAQQTQLAQAGTLLGALDDQLVTTVAALESLDGNLEGIQTGISTARTDVLALGSASAMSALSTLTGLDKAQIADFVASPVEVSEVDVFPVDTYGSAMAALFTNLSLWIGAFVLMVIFKVEVDTEGIEDITVREAYLGRFLLLAGMVTLQALIVTIGNLIIGVQTVSAVAFVGTGVLVGLAYLSIIYALCVAFGHVGRGLAILLVIMQIPGASGLYPIEMMPGFFRTIYPFLPFTYGIDAFRETIGGFYGAHYWKYLGTLAIFVVLAFILGLVLRSRLTNFNRMFNREVAATDLLVSENVQVGGNSYRLRDVLHALSNRREYRDSLAERAERFRHHYPTFLRITTLTGAAGLAVLGIVAWLLPGGKAWLLGIWVLWCLLLIGFLVTIEYIKQSFELSAEVGGLDDEHLRQELVRDHHAHAEGGAHA